MKWTKEEVEFLTGNYAEHGPTYCAEKLGRTYKSVQAKAGKLDLTKPKEYWSRQEQQFLVENYAEHGPNYCSEKLNRMREAVKSKASRLGIALTRPTDWTKEEVQFLTDNYSNNGPVYCAEKLSRTYRSVQSKACKLGLQANTRYDSKIIYVVYFSDLFLYKVGITNNVEYRIKQFGHLCVILKTEECETPQEAAELERDLLKSVTLINTGYLNSGNTETFTEPSEKIKQFLGKQFAE